MVRGIGEQVEPLPFEARAYVLLLPPFGVDTAAVYRQYDESPPADPSVNELEAAALVVEPRLAAWRDELARRTGAVPRLAGSGSTWFVEGTFESLRLGDDRAVRVGGLEGVVVEVHAVPPGWEWGPADG
jgi:4-diphosphocytidyl-2-C-methyl-D-erythritol kinase